MSTQGQPLRVLLVEDSQDDADLILFALGEGGFDVTSKRVENEAEMRATLRGGVWDVVISDFNLPAFWARGALAALRETDPDIPFIIVSGCIGEESAVALMKEGASDFVMKDQLARLAPAIGRELRDASMRRKHRQAEELLRKVTATVGEGIYVLDERGELLFMNPEAERLLGWNEKELVWKNVHSIIHARKPDGDPMPESCCGALDVLKTGGVYRTDDDVFVRKNGTLMPVSFVSTPIMENGRAVASVTAFQDTTRRKQAEQELLESRRQLRELSAHLLSVREEERTRIARELHDELGQLLTAVKLDAGWLSMQLDGANPGAVRKAEAIAGLVDQTLDAMRRIAADLRPVMLDDLGLAAAVEWLTEDFAERTGIEVSLSVSRTQCKKQCEWECSLQWDDDLDADLATAAFRIVQECLTNVARHAGAGRVLVSLQCLDGNLLLQVSDDGNGLAPSGGKQGSYGVIGMRERARALGGVLELSSVPGRGTTVEATIPIASAASPGGMQ